MVLKERQDLQAPLVLLAHPLERLVPPVLLVPPTDPQVPQVLQALLARLVLLAQLMARQGLLVLLAKTATPGPQEPLESLEQQAKPVLLEPLTEVLERLVKLEQPERLVPLV